MAGLLAASMVVVVLYCLARPFVPVLAAVPHHHALDLWHVLMGSAMAAMLLVPYSRALSIVALGVFGAGLGWSLVRLAGPVARAAYVRLAVGCAAMAAMLLPAATAAAATPASASHAMAGGDAMGAMAGMGSGAPGLAPPGALVVALLVALGVILAVRLVRVLRPAAAAATRLDACCDVAMSAAMGYLLLLML